MPQDVLEKGWPVAGWRPSSDHPSRDRTQNDTLCVFPKGHPLHTEPSCHAEHGGEGAEIGREVDHLATYLIGVCISYPTNREPAIHRPAKLVSLSLYADEEIWEPEIPEIWAVVPLPSLTAFPVTSLPIAASDLGNYASVLAILSGFYCCQ